MFIEKYLAIIVPRNRFLPVKTTSDLFLVMSNLYCVRVGSLIMNPSRKFPDVPNLRLCNGFLKVRELLLHFRSIPDILELLHQLIVYNNMTLNFSENISLKVIMK